MSSADDPVDLGFLSHYVVNTNGQLNDSVGATGSSPNPPAVDFYEFSYPGGLQQVTITLTYSAASGSQGDELKSIQVIPQSNLTFSAPGATQIVTTESVAGSSTTLSNQYSVNYNVASGNPGVAYFDVYAQDMTNSENLQAPYAVTVYDKYEVPPVCFVTGTLIRTARGDVAVEHLAIGDLVVTASGARRPIRWLGHRTITCASHPTPSNAWPVRILAGAFGHGLPERDLSLSPGHPVLVGADDDREGGVLVPIMCFINGTTVARAPADEVTYWHVELDEHDILLAEGLPAESFLDLGNRPWFAADAQRRAADRDPHDPDFIPPGLAGRCRPVAIEGSLVEAERRRLDAVFATGLAAQCRWPSAQETVAGPHWG